MLLKKVLTAIAVLALLLSSAGCEQSQIAGTPLDGGGNTQEMTEEEKQKLKEYLIEALRELDVDVNQEGIISATAGPETGQGTSSSMEEPAPEPKESEADFFIMNKQGHVDRTLTELIEHYRGVDEKALDDVISRMDRYDRENKQAEDAAKEISDLYDELVFAFHAEQLQSQMSDLIFNLATDDESKSEKVTEDSRRIETLYNNAQLAVKRVLEGPYGDEMSGLLSEDEKKIYLAAEPMSERQKELNEEYSKLVTEYKSFMGRPVEVTYEGKTYSSETFRNENIDDEAKTAIGSAINEKQSQEVWPLYQKVIRNRNELAKECGYRDYIQMAYSDIYDRDYTAEDIKKLSDSVASYMQGLLLTSTIVMGKANMSDVTTEMTTQEMLTKLREQLAKLSPEFDESMDYLIRNELYTVGPESARTDGAYMDSLYAMNSGYIFGKSNGTADDYETLTHEFGHFNNAYHTGGTALAMHDHMDILEIHSQGLELLASTTLGNVFEAESGDFSAGITLDMVQNVLSAAMVARFEIDCFENPDMTYEEANAAFGKWYSVIMMGNKAEEAKPIPLWVSIHHLFECPQYYISYSISALSALNIFAEYLVNPEEGMARYLKLVEIDPHTRYTEAMKETGLLDMTKPANIQSVAEDLNRHYTEMFINSLAKGENLGNRVGSLVEDLLGPVSQN